jgi:hypothetical protein
MFFILAFLLGVNVGAAPAKTQVDYVFVMDTSTGMVPDLKFVRAEMEQFYLGIEKSQVDFRIFVTTMDMRTNGGISIGPTPFIDQATPDWKMEFINRLFETVGQGSDREAGFESALKLLESSKVHFRTRARLNVIFISNEDDSSDISVEEMSERLQNYPRISTHFLGVTESLGLPENLNQSIEIGELYMGLAKEFSGQIGCLYGGK